MARVWLDIKHGIRHIKAYNTVRFQYECVQWYILWTYKHTHTHIYKLSFSDVLLHKQKHKIIMGFMKSTQSASGSGTTSQKPDPWTKPLDQAPGPGPWIRPVNIHLNQNKHINYTIINNAKKPYIVFGQGIILSQAEEHFFKTLGYF